ncbi:conjugal transfer protein TrbI [Legionella nautarum]|uniref:Conjugal transfer protein TrbI n=1 Tax=Legionella nautarum TaxID=45070 RepID=A0A0W0X213_9GAMM|nr:TrbI/VirB10 family protein [Legionella nautarum]KTD38609.1 conjugal transfer protein TrbI [Legionella nautarum]
MMYDSNVLSADSSPSRLEKSTVRRVNNLPLVIALAALAIFVLMIALVAVKRANLQNKPQEVVKTHVESRDSLALANDIIGDRHGGIIPPANPVKTVTESIVLPVAVIEKPDLPPKPTKEEIPADSEVERIRQVKMQLFEEAVKAKTSVEFNLTPKTQGRVYNSETISIDGNIQTNQTDSSKPLGGTEDEKRWVLHSAVEKPSTPFMLRAGGVIPGVMISGVRSDLPGQIKGQVSQNVYDTATGKYLLIPQGTQLLGLYSTDVSYGQNSLLVAWQRLTFPDGKVLDIGSMPGADGAGYAGFRDEVNNHYVRIFGSALLMSGVVAGITYSQNHSMNGPYSSPTAGSVLSQALGQQLGEVTAQMIAKNLNIAPDLKIRSGYRFNVTVVKDLAFKKPYHAFDYQ